ncbi:MAG TPA: phosphotransferase [Clostridia bacterium]|nr:phosphotransferase [Clostridia bacterium]
MEQTQKMYMDYIAAHFPGTDPGQIQFDFFSDPYSDIVSFGGRVLKFSRYDWSAAHLMNEVGAIRLIRPYVDLPLPHVNLLETDVSLCEPVPGKPLLRHRLFALKNTEQSLIAAQLGVFLKQLRSIPQEEALRHGIRETSPSLEPGFWKREYDDLWRKIAPYCDNSAKEQIQELFGHVWDNEKFLQFTPSVLHGDLTPEHIRYDCGTNGICTVTGFGLARLGDPAEDYAALLAGYGEGFLRRMEKHDDALPELIDRARFYASLRPLRRARELADRITTRDFSGFRLCLTESDLMPVGFPW